jgi:uncharacterized protein YutE (UPF0331/DUF86 family)
VTPGAPNAAVLERRLAFQRDLLAEMKKLEPLTSEQLVSNPVLRAAVERMMQAVVDLALDINGHIASSMLHRSPATGRESFDMMVTAGVLEQADANRLKSAVGLRNILVHMYADIDVGVIADSALVFEESFSAYVRTVARWLMTLSND